MWDGSPPATDSPPYFYDAVTRWRGWLVIGPQHPQPTVVVISVYELQEPIETASVFVKGRGNNLWLLVFEVKLYSLSW